MQTMHPTPSPDNDGFSPDRAEKTALLLLAVGLNAVEYFLPRIPVFPWLKPGIANIVTIIWIIRWGAADALVFAFVRSWITSFFFGFSMVSFMLSISGGVLAAAGMGALWALFGRRGWIGLVGIGVAGAVFHNAGQLCGVYLLLAALPAVWYQVPFMLFASLLFGSITGCAAHVLVPLLGKEALSAAAVGTAPAADGRMRLLAGVMLLAAGCCIACVRSPGALVVSAVLASLLAFGAERWHFRVFLLPVRRFWPLFTFVGVMYLFFSYGRTVAGISFVTYEGAREALLQWLRLWTWIELSLVLSRMGFNRLVLHAAARVLPFGRDTVVAAVLALELFPAFVGLLKPHAKTAGNGRFLRWRTGGAASSIERLYGRIRKLVSAGTAE
jgi:heptaprenyl diphosphate synthase